MSTQVRYSEDYAACYWNVAQSATHFTICLPTLPFVYPLYRLSIHFTICLPTFPFVYPLYRLSTHFTICLPTLPFVYPLYHLSTHLTICTLVNVYVDLVVFTRIAGTS